MVPLIQPVLVDMGYMYNGRWQHIADTYTETRPPAKGFPWMASCMIPRPGSARTTGA